MKLNTIFQDKTEEEYRFFIFLLNKYSNKVLGVSLDEANEFLVKNGADKRNVLPVSEDNKFIYTEYLLEAQSEVGTKKFVKLCKYIYYYLESCVEIDNYTGKFFEKYMPDIVFTEIKQKTLETLKRII